MVLKIKGIHYKLRLNSDEALAYVRSLNKDGEKRYHGLRATGADESGIQAGVEQNGDFILCLIPHAFLRGLEPGNKKRAKLIRQFIEHEHNLGNIPPILVEGTSPTCLKLFDGHARASASYNLGRPILGYVPERLISKLPGVMPFGWKVRVKSFFGRH